MESLLDETQTRPLKFKQSSSIQIEIFKQHLSEGTETLTTCESPIVRESRGSEDFEDSTINHFSIYNNLNRSEKIQMLSEEELLQMEKRIFQFLDQNKIKPIDIHDELRMTNAGRPSFKNLSQTAMRKTSSLLERRKFNLHQKPASQIYE
ncbi:UNKNOWN [Stylonychia lemnae]|uniref:Uncharacterized protein n=1 Tax=Stylonychia lemnae TaxID=5949 RepID=A0A078A6N0_STYLE|nr:UNKNOWN [Stylonychia lemnae]|eukprot:CDW77252.1 UNKNOWN [Stylonychia lemnae]